MGTKIRKVVCWVFLGLLLAAPAWAQAPSNLVRDASFESPLPAWFEEKGRGTYYAAKEMVEDAAGGRFVLAIRGWQKTGGKILSPPIALEAGACSATAMVRSYGKVGGATVELALFDAEGSKRIVSFGKAPLDGKGQWSTISRSAVRLRTSVEGRRLAVVVTGPQRGARVEVDLVGLFPGERPGKVLDNVSLAGFEAEEMADGKAWVVRDHYGGWYRGFPNRMKMLAGTQGVTPEDNEPVSRTVTVRRAGRHKLWIRFVTVNTPSNGGKYTFAIRQGGKVLASKEIFDADAQYPRLQWVWDSIETDLASGKAEIVLTRPDAGTSGVARKVDLFLLTNRLDYEPAVEHLRPQGYMRFTNLSKGLEPFCLWIWIRRHQAPWHMNLGMLSHAGASRSFRVPRDESLWLAPGDASPWIRISDELAPAGGRNNVSLLATRNTHTGGFVEGRVRGKLEFSLGAERKVVKTIDIDQEAPRIVLTLPDDFKAKADEIRSAFDYIEEKRAVLDRIGRPEGKRARHLELIVGFALNVGADDPAVIEAEIDVMKRMGFNGTYSCIAPPETAADFYRRHGLETRFGAGIGAVWGKRLEGSMHHPDVDAIGRIVKDFAEKNEPIADHLHRLKLMDEPGGMSYAAVVKSDLCRQKFVEQLKREGLAPKDLGVESWDRVVPVDAKQSGDVPELFYHTAIFRLQAMAELVRACTRIKNDYLPGRALTYVNYSPPYSGGSWTIRGTDPFFCQRDGALEIGWTEDWLGYGASTQHLSDVLALLRSAGRPRRESLGCYLVGQGTPTLMRLKYYTLLAGGTRFINVYNYGPWYASIDSWSRNFDIYPPIVTCQHEFGVIDGALKGAVRRKTDVAILYNRTSAVWEKTNYTSEQNNWYTHWALAHAGYDADFIPEEDVESGYLSNYKVLYLSGAQLRRESARAIAEWVEAGGVLFGSAGAGSRDQYNRPMDVLDPVFGARSKDLELKQNVGRPKYELRTRRTLDVLSSVPDSAAPEISLNQLCFQETLEPLAGAQVILKNKAGAAAGVMNTWGKGRAIRLAAVPGIAYLNDAVRDKDYDANSYLPRDFRREMRDFIAWPAKLADAVRVAETDDLITEIVRFEGAGREVVVVIDRKAEARDEFTMSLPGAALYSRAYTATGNAVKLGKGPGDSLTVTMPLDVADAVVLLK